MKRALLALAGTFLTCFVIFSQDNNVNAYLDAFQNNFERSSGISTKIEILQDAAEIDREGMAPIYTEALEYILNNPDIFYTDPLSAELTTMAIRLIGAINYQQASYALWQIFKEIDQTGVRVEALSVLGSIAKGNEEIDELMTAWLDAQNTLHKDGVRTDLQVISEMVSALGKIAAPASFPVLFTAGIIGYSNEISEKARDALLKIDDDFMGNIINIIQSLPAQEKVAAFELALSAENLSDEELGNIAETALNYGNSTVAATPEEKTYIRTLRYESAKVLKNLSWSQATDAIIEHFDLAVLEYERGLCDKSQLLEAIACLGSMATHEAAVRLTLYIELLNHFVESGQNIDEQIILTVIQNLGALGDKVALDSLLYVKYLNYSNTVKKAAREAQSNLKIR